MSGTRDRISISDYEDAFRLLKAERDAAVREQHRLARVLGECSSEGGLIKEQRDAALKERDEAREVARDFWPDLGHMGEYLFKKHYEGYKEQYPWLVEVPE